MKRLVPGIEVVGGEKDACQGKTRSIRDGERLKMGGVSIVCLATPCHTSGHTSYIAEAEGQPPAIFTGACDNCTHT